MTPNLGQGACQAIEDALVLARCIAGARGAPALRRYEADRIPRTTSIVLGSRRVGRVGQVQSPIACRFRAAALRLMPRSVTFRQLAPVIGYQSHLG